MTLYIAGINHFDPLGPQMLLDWLKRLFHERKEANPCFIAVERDELAFSKVKAQRPGFSKLLSETWPNWSCEVIEALVRTLGYEGDTHLAVFPSVDILWLDQGRDYEATDPHAIDQFAEARLCIYKRTVRCGGISIDSPSMRKDLSRGVAEMAKKDAEIAAIAGDPNREDPRDAKWAKLLLDRIGKCKTEWAVAIVGFNHAAGDIPGSMRNIVEKAGGVCRGHVFNPDPGLGRDGESEH